MIPLPSWPHNAADPSEETADAVAFWPLIPKSAPPSDYDFRNAALYLRLLLAEASGAGEGEIARDVFLHLKTPSHRLMAARSHRDRAHWLFENGFLPLLWAIDD